MTHVSLDNLSESTKQFILSLSVELRGSVLELGGKEVLRVYPPNCDYQAVGDDWTDAKNERRCELIDKEIDGSISAAEAAELEDLQEQMLRYRHRIAPLPLARARKLLEELERKAQVAERSA